MGEQLRGLRALDIPYTVTPGVPSFAAAAATLEAELTLPGLSQSVVLTRTSGRASAMPDTESLANFAATQAVLAIHLSIHVLPRVVAELSPHYGADCPVAVVWRASWPDERVVRATLATIEARDWRKHGAHCADPGGPHTRPKLGRRRLCPQPPIRRRLRPALPPAGHRAPLPGRHGMTATMNADMKVDLCLVGIGTGNPDHVTRQGVKALNAADLILVPHKGEGKADLAELRLALCRELVTNPATQVVQFDMPVRDAHDPDYPGAVNRWHDAIAEVWLAENPHPFARRGAAWALLVWGDPSLYDSTLRIADRLALQLPLTVSVVPGITALQALTAAHAIALNDINAPVTITTGRQLRDHGWPESADTIAVMLDGHCAFQHLPPEGITIWWGAYLGMPQQICIAGPLAEVNERIQAGAPIRARGAWVGDGYLFDAAGI